MTSPFKLTYSILLGATVSFTALAAYALPHDVYPRNDQAVTPISGTATDRYSGSARERLDRLEAERNSNVSSTTGQTRYQRERAAQRQRGVESGQDPTAGRSALGATERLERERAYRAERQQLREELSRLSPEERRLRLQALRNEYRNNPLAGTDQNTTSGTGDDASAPPSVSATRDTGVTGSNNDNGLTGNNSAGAERPDTIGTPGVPAGADNTTNRNAATSGNLGNTSGATSGNLGTMGGAAGNTGNTRGVVRPAPARGASSGNTGSNAGAGSSAGGAGAAGSGGGGGSGR